MGRLQQVDEVVKELFAEVIYVFLWIVTDQEHLPNMTLTLYMAFEAIFVAHLTLTWLTIPS